MTTEELLESAQRSLARYIGREEAHLKIIASQKQVIEALKQQVAQLIAELGETFRVQRKLKEGPEGAQSYSFTR